MMKAGKDFLIFQYLSQDFLFKRELYLLNCRKSNHDVNDHKIGSI